MNKNRYIIAIGSNIAPDKNVKATLEIISQEQTLIASSKFYQTTPVGYQDQDDFLNGSAYVTSDLDFEQFNLYLKNIEKRLKRVKGPIKSGPRTIDLDIIIHNEKIIDSAFHTATYIHIPVQELIEKLQIDLV